MIINIENVGKHGVIRDVKGRALPPEAWTDGQNVRFVDGFAEKVRGHREIYAGLGMAPYFLLPISGTLNTFWLAAGLAGLKVHDGSSWFDITRLAGPYTANINTKWTGGSFSNVAILNNSNDNPQSWALATGTKALDLVNWPGPGITTMRCGVMRPFLNQLIAGDITKDSIRFPMMVKWSSVSDPGTLPASWDAADASKLTGEKDLADTPGIIMDMAPAGNTNVVYKEDAVVAMNFTGRTFVYDWEYLSKIFGVFTQNCIGQIGPQGRQIAFGYDDVVQIDGRKLESVIRAKDRRWLYANLDKDNKNNSFVVTHHKEKEVWICFPGDGSTFCNLAMIYNWRDNTWGVKDLPGLIHADTGIYTPNAGPQVIDDLTTLLIDNWQSIIDVRNLDPTQRHVIGADPTTSKVFQFDNTEQADGVNFTASLEREALAVTLTRTGNLVHDFENRKLIKRVFPQVDGTGFMQVDIGGQETPGGPISWTSLAPYEIGVTPHLDAWVSTPLPAFRFSSVGNQSWKLTGYAFEQEMVGKHW